LPFLSPGEKAIIVTGRSPKGVSFRLNICTGYFSQFQNFTPSLPKQCPLQRDEDYPTGPNGVTDICIDYLESIGRCETNVGSLPLLLASDPVCQEYISLNVHYGGCVNIHKNDSDFYKSEWRIFLGRGNALWKDRRETILLVDEEGKTVDSMSY